MSTFQELYLQGDQNVQVPAHLNFGKFMLDRLRGMGDEVALVCSTTGEKLTYNELTQYAVDLSMSLMKLGVGRGDVVALGSEIRIMFIPTALAVIFSGASLTPYEETCGRAALQHKLNIVKPNYFICSKLFWDENSDVLKSTECIKTFITLDDAPSSAVSIESLISENNDVKRFEPADVQGQSDTAFILYSSGTTGMSKAILWTHLNTILNCADSDFFKEESFKIMFVEGEWRHSYGLRFTYMFLFLGKTMVFPKQATSEGILKCIENFKVDVAILNPAWISLIVMEDIGQYNVDSLKIIHSSSASIDGKTMENVKQSFPKIKIVQCYGMTEAGPVSSEIWVTKGPKPGSVGRLHPGITLKIVDLKTEKVLGSNQHGEIRIKGPSLVKATYIDKEGFLMTGDLGFYDEDGYIFIVARLKEIIKYNGFNISPSELETILLQHPGVREVAVVGKPVPIYGDTPAAFVVKQPGATVTEQELIDLVTPEVPLYMQLKGGVRFVLELPRNLSGKVLRRQLKKMLNETN